MASAAPGERSSQKRHRPLVWKVLSHLPVAPERQYRVLQPARTFGGARGIDARQGLPGGGWFGRLPQFNGPKIAASAAARAIAVRAMKTRKQGNMARGNAAEDFRPAVHQWSQIWKKNPNLENIFRNPVGGSADFAFCDCRIAGRRGEIEVVSCELSVVGCQLSVVSSSRCRAASVDADN